MDHTTGINDSDVGSATTDERFTDRAARVVDQAKTAGRAAVDTIDDQREAAARTLSSAASKLHSKAAEYSDRRLTGAAHKTADTLEATADFMREHPLARIKDDVTAAASRNPGTALILAACVGFLVGRALTRD